jgi:hypothetical protein
MKEYKATMTINVFIEADSEEEAQGKFEELDMSFRDTDGNYLEDQLIDWEISEVVD